MNSIRVRRTIGKVIKKGIHLINKVNYFSGEEKDVHMKDHLLFFAVFTIIALGFLLMITTIQNL